MKERREKEEERKWDRTCAPEEKAEGEERFLHPEKPPQWQRDQLGQRGASGAQRRAQQLVCGRQDRVRHTQMVRAITLHTAV